MPSIWTIIITISEVAITESMCLELFIRLMKNKKKYPISPLITVKPNYFGIKKPALQLFSKESVSHKLYEKSCEECSLNLKLI